MKTIQIVEQKQINVSALISVAYYISESKIACRVGAAA